MITVLFVNPSNGLSGDTLSLGYLIESLNGRVNPIVLLRDRGEATDFFESLGVECIVHNYLTVFRSSLGFKGIITHPWRIRFIKLIRFELPCILYVKKQLAGRNIDIVHTNTLPTTIGVKLAKALKAKHIWHIREFLSPPHVNTKIVGGIGYLRHLMNQADAQIYVSNPCMEHWHPKNQNSWMIWDAIKWRKDACYIKNKQPYILFLAQRIIEAKGVSFAVKAFGMSGIARMGITLKIVGNASEWEICHLQEIAHQWGCADAIEFIPFQTDVKSLFANAKVFIQSSANEGIGGRTTIEAMFFGCPVIALPSGGTLDLIRNEETGWFFETVEECSDLMKKVCMTEHEEIIINAQSFAMENFSVDDYGEKILAVYKHVLG